MKVIKKDGTLENYNEQKIIDAVNKSAQRVLVKLSNEDYKTILNEVWRVLVANDLEDTDIADMHNIVESVLEAFDPRVAKSYRDYRNYKTDFVHILDDVYKKAQSIMYIGDKENSNTDSALVSTKRSLIYNELNKELYRNFFMNREELQACKDGYIYVHDQSARRDTMNCCLFDVANVLKGGFEMGNIWYNEPTSLDTAFDVIGDIVLSSASQQYGGWTLPRADSILAPYAEMSYKKYYDEFISISKDFYLEDKTNDELESLAHDYAMKKVQREMEQGYQGWEYKFNTVASSRGDYPFITISFGLGTSRFERMASKTFLRIHREGQGKEGSKKPVLFPKLVFLYTDGLHGVGAVNEDVFEEALLCSSKTMYPDYVSLDGDNTIGRMYHKYGKVISPMGK